MDNNETKIMRKITKRLEASIVDIKSLVKNALPADVSLYEMISMALVSAHAATNTMCMMKQWEIGFRRLKNEQLEREILNNTEGDTSGEKK